MARQLTGTVTSDKGDKTIVITVRARRTHPVYKKQYTVNTKFMAHDEKNEAQLGDLVTIVETRPLSARKRFILDKIIERSGARFEESDAVADVVSQSDEQPAPKTPTKASKPAARKPKSAQPKENDK